MSSTVVSVLLLNFLIVATPVHATVIIINNPNPTPFSGFGNSIDSRNGVMAVGVPGVDAGRVLMFDATTGSLIRTLFSPNPQSGGGFGSSVEVASDLLVVGAPGETVNGIAGAGRVYIFTVETGALLDTLVSSNPEDLGGFGRAVNLASGLLAVGAPFETGNGLLAGRVHVFDAPTGLETTTLVSPNRETRGLFGAAIDVSDGRIIVGAPGAAAFHGLAYVFSATTSALISTLVSPNAPNELLFGRSVAIVNQQAFVGSPGETVNGLEAAGSVYVFNAVTGSLVRTFTDPNAQSGYFGVSLALAGNNLLVGAPFDQVSAFTSGRVYVFSAATGTLTDTLVSPDTGSPGGLGFGSFGDSVDVAKGHVYIGAPTQPVNGQPWAGAVYVFAGIIGHGQSGSDDQ